jgi:hypothetical protein
MLSLTNDLATASNRNETIVFPVENSKEAKPIILAQNQESEFSDEFFSDIVSLVRSFASEQTESGEKFEISKTTIVPTKKPLGPTVNDIATSIAEKIMTRSL